MWLYVNEAGNISTIIPHGQTPRQRNCLDVFVCFENEVKNQNLKPIISFCSESDSHYHIEGYPAGLYGRLVTFKKNDIDEAIYDFVPGKRYIVYQWHVPQFADIVQGYGKSRLQITLQKNGTERIANVPFYIEHTYEDSSETTITAEEYDNLIKLITSSSFFFKYPMEEISGKSLFENDNDRIYLYSFHEMGMLSGRIKLDENFTIDSNTNISGFTKIAECKNQAFDFGGASTIWGTTSDGNDVEFRLIGEKEAIVDPSTLLETGEYTQVIGLYINNNSINFSANSGSKINVSGTFKLNGNVLDFNSDTDYPYSYITGVNASVSTQTSETPSVNVNVIHDGSKATVNFDFVLPKVEVVEEELKNKVSNLESDNNTNKTDIAKNTADIEKNTSAISSLEIRTKSLESEVGYHGFDMSQPFDKSNCVRIGSEFSTEEWTLKQSVDEIELSDEDANKAKTILLKAIKYGFVAYVDSPNNVYGAIITAAENYPSIYATFAINLSNPLSIGFLVIYLRSENGKWKYRCFND